MKFNNDLKCPSARSAIVCVVLSIAITAIAIVWYLSSTTVNPSFIGFCVWYNSAFHAFLADSHNDIFEAYLLFIILPLIFYGSLIFTIFAVYMEKKVFTKSLNLQSVEFVQDRIFFNFNRPQYNFVCGYKDIDNLEMDIKTVLVRTKYGSYPTVSTITLNFAVLNNKKFSLTSNSTSYMKKIYSILEYSRGIQNFSYKFSGIGKLEDIDEKIRDYLNTGCKQILSSRREEEYKWLSIGSFIIGLIFIYVFRDVINNDNSGISVIILVPVSIIFIFSFVFDIYLLADKWNENRCKRF